MFNALNYTQPFNHSIFISLSTRDHRASLLYVPAFVTIQKKMLYFLLHYTILVTLQMPNCNIKVKLDNKL